jgi:protein phosphatase
MGCTVCVALLRGRGAYIAHVGDSRVYLRRRGVTYLLTEDHSFGRELYASGALTEQEVAVHPQRQMLTRAIGSLPTVRVDTAFIELAAGDTLLLCSDGLHGEVTSQTIDAGLDAELPEQAARALLQAALAAGGKDNVTVVVARLSGTPLPEPEVIGSELARAALAQSALFTACTPSELVRVQRLALARLIPAGGQALAQGTANAELMVLLTGSLSVWNAGEQLGVLLPGDPFGALALVAEPAAATYRAETDSLLLVFPLAELSRVLAVEPALAAKLALAALARLSRRVVQLAAALASQRRREAATAAPDSART